MISSRTPMAERALHSFFRCFKSVIGIASSCIIGVLIVGSPGMVSAESVIRPTIVSVDVTGPSVPPPFIPPVSSSTGTKGSRSVGSLRLPSINRKNEEIMRMRRSATSSFSSSRSSRSAMPGVVALPQTGVPLDEWSTGGSAHAAAAVLSGEPASGSPVFGLCPLLDPLCVGGLVDAGKHFLTAIVDVSPLGGACGSSASFLWIIVLLLMLWVAFLAFWLGMRAAAERAYGDTGFVHHFFPLKGSWWYTANCMALLLIIVYAVFIVLEVSGAATETTVGVTVTQTSLSVDCTEAVSLGSFQENGDTGLSDPLRSATCTIYALNPAGYTLSWQVRSGSGGTATGKLIAAGGHTIDPFVPTISSTPEPWMVAAGTSGWGGRLSSDSTVSDIALWGTDGLSEKWLNVGTGSFILSARSTPTGMTPDIERIAFRAAAAAPLTLAPGRYSASVLFTITGN